MTETLRTSGAIGADSAVTSISNEAYEAGGLLSLLYRSTIESDDPGAPDTVIVKFPTDVPHMRALADDSDCYFREVAFYREIAPRSTIRMPEVHAAISAGDKSNSCIVMEDLAHMRQPDRIDGMTWDDAVRGARNAGRVPRRLPGIERARGAVGDLLPPGRSGETGRGWAPSARCAWPAAKEIRGHTLSAEVVELGDVWTDSLDEMLDRMETRPTLCHQDWRSDNMFFDANGNVVMIDPQIAGVCNGAFDLAYFISQSTERDMLDGRHRELIHEYLSVMAEHGHDLDPDVFFFDVRVAVGLVLMYGFASYPQYDALSQEGKAMTDKLLRRGAQAIEDFDSLAAIRELTA